jgi:hypothetical protein
MLKRANFKVLLLILTLAPIAKSLSAASIVWGTREGAGARSICWNCYLEGIRVPGGQPLDLSNGDLVLLIKVVGEMDPPWAIETTDDIVLDAVHVGYGLFPAGAPARGEWLRLVNVNISPGDVIYAKACDRPADELRCTAWNTDTEFVSHVVAQVSTTATYYFDNLWMGISPPIPPVIQGISAFEDMVTLIWRDVDATYTLQEAPTPGGPWTDVYGPTDETSLTIPIPAGNCGFYRIKVP